MEPVEHRQQRSGGEPFIRAYGLHSSRVNARKKGEQRKRVCDGMDIRVYCFCCCPQSSSRSRGTTEDRMGVRVGTGSK